MFCTACGKEFELWKKSDWWMVDDFCPDCFEIKWSKEGLNLKNKDTYCIKCGDILKKSKRKTRNGQIIFTSSNKRYCDKCRELKKAPIIRKCVVCGSVIKGRAHKYCENCKPYTKKSNPYPLTNRKSSIKWAKNNPEKVKASRIARYKSYKVNIIYECPCAVDEKHNHHFDYERPFDVICLCPKCHALEHARLRALEKQSNQRRSDMKNLTDKQTSLIQSAKEQYGEISYCGDATCWNECFTFTTDPDEIHFWFNDQDRNTHVISETL